MTTDKSNRHVSATRQELIMWWLPLILIFAASAALRLMYVSRDLPANEDPDEWYYFVWARAILETGYPNVEDGAGYPPGLLYLLAGEQRFLEIVLGSRLNPSVDYFVLARTINAIFGALCIFLIAELGRQTGKSRITGLACALLVGVLGLMVSESRRGAANAPWLFFTLLCFVFLFLARDSRNLAWLYSATCAGVISFLFKYQSGVILILPFVYGIVYFRSRKGLWGHLTILGLSLTVLLAWLIFDYQIAQIVNTPTTDTASVVQAGQLAGLQSLESNWEVIARSVGSVSYLWGAVAALPLALTAFVWRRLDEFIDRGAVLTFSVFAILFYLLMSLFRQAAAAKWLVLIAVAIILAHTTFFAALRILGALVGKPWGLSRPLSTGLSMVVLLYYTASLSVQQWQNVTWTYENIWTKPSALNELNTWFTNNVPQGARVISEANKMVYDYVHAPRIVHVHVVGSIFDDSIADYQQRGYEYLVWNSMKSRPTDSLADLEARRDLLLSAGAHETLRLTSHNSAGADIVVFQLPPLQQHPLYTWFTPAISFRGYDLNSDTFRPGDEVQLMLYWMSAERVPNNYIVFIHLINRETGQLDFGHDGPPDYGNTPTYEWRADMDFIRDQRIFNLPVDLASGEYALSIGMYDADTKARVQILDLQYQPLGDSLELQKITVKP